MHSLQRRTLVHQSPSYLDFHGCLALLLELLAGSKPPEPRLDGLRRGVPPLLQQLQIGSLHRCQPNALQRGGRQAPCLLPASSQPTAWPQPLPCWSTLSKGKAQHHAQAQHGTHSTAQPGTASCRPPHLCLLSRRWRRLVVHQAKHQADPLFRLRLRRGWGRGKRGLQRRQWQLFSQQKSSKRLSACGVLACSQSHSELPCRVFLDDQAAPCLVAPCNLAAPSWRTHLQRR